jgi:tetratricopeptide (TPR) repeat protein
MPDGSVFFQRYQPQDSPRIVSKIEQDHKLLDKALATNDELLQLELLSRLGANYTMLEKEERAVPLLEQALLLARQRGDKRLEVANLLSLATSMQYLGQREKAQELFQEALDKVYANYEPYYEDFVLQHRGRCYVEQGKIEEAINCFGRALSLRERKGDPRGIEASQHALDAVRAIRDRQMGNGL